VRRAAVFRKGAFRFAACDADRLRARFAQGDTLPDYEFLELVLFRSIPRRDVKPIAAR